MDSNYLPILFSGVNKHIFYVKRKSCNSRPHFKNQLMDNTLLFLKDFFKKVLIIYTLDISTLTCYGKFFSKKKKPVNNYFGVSIKVLLPCMQAITITPIIRMFASYSRK